jgi:hypothetical protein
MCQLALLLLGERAIMRPLLPSLLFVAALAAPGAAFAGVVHGGESIHLRVAGHREPGRALRAEPDGWRLAVSAPDTIAQLLDVTAHAAPDKWLMPITHGGVVLDLARFRPGHAYRVEIRRGATTLETAYVYLSPPIHRGPGRVTFTADADPAGTDEIAIIPKSAL